MLLIDLKRQRCKKIELCSLILENLYCHIYLSKVTDSIITYMKYFLQYISLVILLTSCTENYDCRWNMKKDCRDSIIAYISSHPEYNAYLVVFKHELTDQMGIRTTGFLIGPLYYQLRIDLRSALLINTNNAKVFILSDMQDFLETSEMSTNDNDLDSFGVDYNKGETAAVNYVRHAVYMHYKDSILIINNRPDTLFLPKIIKDEMIVEDEMNRDD